MGTAWHLAESGHPVTVVSPDPFIGKELARTTADFPIRRRLARAGAKFLVESVVEEWQGNAAIVRSLLDDSTIRIEASALVFATTNRACNELELRLREQNTTFELHTIGDCVAPRQAPFAFFEGRKLGIRL